MIKTALIFILIISSTALCLDGPDFMLLGISYTPDSGFFNRCSGGFDNEGFAFSFQNASLYDINSLDWNFAGVRYSHLNWTAIGTFRMYGIDDLYESSKYSAVVHYLFAERVSVGAGYTRQELDMGNGLYRRSLDIMRFSLGAKLTDVSLDFTVDNIAFNDDDDVTGDPEYFLSGSWQIYQELSLFSVYYRNPYEHDRFLFGQNLNLNEYLNINAGFLSGPEVYFAGFEIIYKGLAFGYTYYDLSGMPNSSKITLVYR